MCFWIFRTKLCNVERFFYIIYAYLSFVSGFVYTLTRTLYNLYLSIYLSSYIYMVHMYVYMLLWKTEISEFSTFSGECQHSYSQLVLCQKYLLNIIFSNMNRQMSTFTIHWWRMLKKNIFITLRQKCNFSIYETYK